MIKILKNTTIADISIKDTGVLVPASGQYIIPAQDYLLWMDSVDIDVHINSGDIVVNNGTKDLSINMGLNYIHDFTIAEDIEFDNATNGFIAINVQTAIEEAKNSSLPDFVISNDTCIIFKEDGGFVLKG